MTQPVTHRNGNQFLVGIGGRHEQMGGGLPAAGQEIGELRNPFATAHRTSLCSRLGHRIGRRRRRLGAAGVDILRHLGIELVWRPSAGTLCPRQICRA